MTVTCYIRQQIPCNLYVTALQCASMLITAACAPPTYYPGDKPDKPERHTSYDLSTVKKWKCATPGCAPARALHVHRGASPRSW